LREDLGGAVFSVVYWKEAKGKNRLPSTEPVYCWSPRSNLGAADKMHEFGGTD